MSAVVRLDDYRPKPTPLRREPDAMSILLDSFTFIGLCNIAVLYALIACARVATQEPRHGDH
jgi:hypothetical protein